MINHGKVRSTIKPESMVIDEYSVWINENIQEIQVEDEFVTSDGQIERRQTKMYEYNMLQYEKDEFIMQQSEQITNTQVALCEIYESLGVQSMAKVYADLIRKGVKTIDDVPKKLQKAVKEILGEETSK